MLIINGQIEFIQSITFGDIIILITFRNTDLLSVRQGCWLDGWLTGFIDNAEVEDDIRLIRKEQPNGR